MFVNSPYFHLQAYRRALRDRGISSYPKPFTYILAVNFPTAGAVQPGEIAQGSLLIDSDSDFMVTRLSWYAQDVPFNPPTSVSVNTQDSTWETSLPASFEMRIEDLRSGRSWHLPRFIEPELFSGWIGVAAAGTPQEDANLEDVTPVAANDTGIGHFPNQLTEPIVLPASSLYQIALRQRASGAVTFSTHLFAFHGARLYKVT